MAKLKKKIAIPLAIFLSTSVMVAIGGMTARRGETTTYKITYVSANGEDIKPFMYKKGGKYPTEYVSGKEVYVDDLLGKQTIIHTKEVYWWDDTTPSIIETVIGSPVQNPNNPNIEYEFYGWYLDKECTQAFDGKIEKTSVGNITLYADIAVAFWTKYY